MKYTKPAYSIKQHLKVMEKRGLRIPDPDKTLHYLKYIGYYRLTGYCLPFQNSAEHSFVKGTSFDDVLKLYVFDRELRVHILGAVEGIEVVFRAAISNTMSLAYDPHWYLDEHHFGKRYGERGSKLTTMQNYSERSIRLTAFHFAIIAKPTLTQFIHQAG